MQERKVKILIADDEEIIRELLCRVLSRQGYEVELAEDGASALEKIRNNNFDMVICDLKMPIMDGMTLIRNVKRIDDDILIMVITGYATVETAKDAIKCGCYDYITKPFDAEELGLIVKRALEGRRLAIEKQRLQENVSRAERLTSLGQMAASMAHEINTTLTSIKLFMEMLQPKIGHDKASLGNLLVILGEIERTENLIERFLNFAKPQEMRVKTVNINEIINKSLELLRYRFDRQNIQINKEFDISVPDILCDPSKMEIALLNIFMNSIEAMPEGGRLNIKTAVTQDELLIFISDNGNGISRDNLRRIFEPFFTTKPDGMGLGLSIVKRIIEECKGRIFITTEEDSGTDVKIELAIKRGC